VFDDEKRISERPSTTKDTVPENVEKANTKRKGCRKKRLV